LKRALKLEKYGSCGFCLECNWNCNNCLILEFDTPKKFGWKRMKDGRIKCDICYGIERNYYGMD